MGIVWGAVKIVGAARGTTEVGEAGGKEVAQCLVV
jgi:hypothetical protein